MRTTEVFGRTIEAWNKHPRYVSSCGGTRSGKTYSILQVLFLTLLGEEMRGDAPTINSVVSESYPHLKRGAIRDFQVILKGEGMWNDGRWSESNKSYTFGNGSILEFFSVDNAGKVYGASRDRLFVNECQHVSYEIVRQLFVRTRGQIILDYNPTHSFWCNEEIEPRKNCITIHSTYRDNDLLTAEQIEEIESNRDNGNWWRVFGEGKIGEVEGLVYDDFEIIPKMPTNKTGLVQVLGMDFGYTNDPTAIVQLYCDTATRTAYIAEVCYRTRMRNINIIAELNHALILKTAPIYADCAEPKSIADIYDAGYNIHPCDKSAPARSERLKAQIDFMKSWKLKVTAASLNVIKEFRSYEWAKDMNGKALTVPIDKFNHAMDAIRYALWTHFAENANKGHYLVR